jgi:hypothetical protein
MKTMASARGEAAVGLIPPAILLFSVRGHWDEPLLRQVVPVADELVRAHRKIRLFFDVEHLAGYDSATRLGMTRWVGDNRPRLRDVHVLVGSKLVAMGTTVANLALGGLMTIHSDRRKFWLAFEAAGGIRPTGT